MHSGPLVLVKRDYDYELAVINYLALDVYHLYNLILLMLEEGIVDWEEVNFPKKKIHLMSR